MYLVFDKRRTEKRRLIHYVLPRRWSHCFCFWDYTGRILAVDPRLDGMCAMLLDEDAGDTVADLIANGVTAIVYRPDGVRTGETNAKYVPRGIYTCVSAVKALLGLKAARYFLVITPRQLFRALAADKETIIIYKRHEVE